MTTRMRNSSPWRVFRFAGKSVHSHDSDSQEYLLLKWKLISNYMTRNKSLMAYMVRDNFDYLTLKRLSYALPK